jgi:hypothetical protein
VVHSTYDNPFNGGNQPPFFQKYKTLIVIGGIVAAVLAVFGIRYVIQQGIISEANKREADLSRGFEVNKAELGKCITQIRETAGVAMGASRELNKVLSDIVSARYTQPNGPQVTSGRAFSLLVEQYPDLSGLQRNFDRVMTVMIGCRDDYQGYQEDLRERAAQFEAWLNGSWTNRTFGKGLPNSKLYADVLDDEGREVRLTGQAALDKMTKLITIADANKAYQTGVMTPEDPFGTATTRPRG